MNLVIQIKSLLVSFLYGVFFYMFFRMNTKYLYYEKLLVRIIISFLFSLDMALLYFIILKEINSGIIHPYFIGMIIIGFITSNFVVKNKIFKRLIKKN